MEEAGNIERVTGPTEWCATMVPLQKSNGKLRICVYLRKRSYWYHKLPWRVRTELCYNNATNTDFLKSDRAWTWGSSQRQAFAKFKKMI